MELTERDARAYKLVCPVPRCCRDQTRHARREHVELCIKKFRKSVSRLSDSERQAYEERLEVWREKIGRGRKWGKMREVAPEPVDWWKDQDGASLYPIPCTHNGGWALFEAILDTKPCQTSHSASLNPSVPSGSAEPRILRGQLPVAHDAGLRAAACVPGRRRGPRLLEPGISRQAPASTEGHSVFRFFLCWNVTYVLN